MGVSIPAFHLRAGKDLPEMRKRLKGQGRNRAIHQELTLTSMIDIMSVVVIFLIQSFSATGEVMMVNKDINLPQANYGRTLNRAPIVTVTPEKVTLEGITVGDNTAIQEKIEETDWELPLLSQRLTSYKTFMESIYPGAVFPGEVIIQADNGLNFLYLKRVMFTLTKLGFNNINLAVRGEVQPVAPAPEAPELNETPGVSPTQSKGSVPKK